MKKELLPFLGEGIDKAVIAEWLVQVGDRIQQNDDLVEVVTDKASFDVPAQTAGILKEILVQEGQEVLVGAPLAIIEFD